MYYQRDNDLWPVSQRIVDQAIAHAKEIHPSESVGVVSAGVYHKLTNIHPVPKDHFAVEKNELGPHAIVGIDALIHSHPCMTPHPTLLDMEQQQECQYPWGIVVFDTMGIMDVFFFGDTIKIAPYEGREFKHGVYDCFSLVRDWYWQEHNIRLPFHPRKPLWWIEKDRVLEENYEDMGFHQIAWDELKYGDCVMGKILSNDVINHCGVYLGQGVLLHHLYGSAKRPRLSLKESIYKWKDYIVNGGMCLRYSKGLQVPAKGIVP